MHTAPRAVFSIILPINDKPDNAKTRELIRKAALAEFGGFTLLPGSGGWRDDNGDDHIEPHQMMRIAVDSAKYVSSTAAGLRIAAFGEVAAFAMMQFAGESAVYVEVDNSGFIFTRESDEIRAVSEIFERDPHASFESLVNRVHGNLMREREERENNPLLRLARELGIVPDGE